MFEYISTPPTHLKGNIIDCKACILGGTDLELLNTAGCTAAHAAATNMHLDLLKLLNEKGKEICTLQT